MKHIILLLLALTLPAFSQSSLQMANPLDSLTPQQKATLAIQSQQFFNAAKPSVAQAAKSTVIISYRDNILSYGTAVKSPLTGDNVILTKWSEISRFWNQLIVTTPQGKYNRGTVVGVYPEYDLALLETNARLTPLNLKNSATPQLGEFIAQAAPDGSVLSLGVVSVKARSLRETDKAYLGVLMDFQNANHQGTPVTEVVPDSPAAYAGLQPGDIVVAIDQRKINGAMEMRNILQKFVPGSDVIIQYRRNNNEFTTTVRLGSRPQELAAGRVPQKRMNTMQRMGAVPNRVRDHFPNVIQSDMPIQPDETPNDPRDNFTNECGGPVVNLDGKVVGITIARGSRIKTFIIPSNALRYLLTTQPTLLRSQVNGRNHSYSPYRTQPTRKIPPKAIPAE
jgi:S1-C subfamily serine protease